MAAKPWLIFCRCLDPTHLWTPPWTVACPGLYFAGALTCPCPVRYKFWTLLVWDSRFCFRRRAILPLWCGARAPLIWGWGPGLLLWVGVLGFPVERGPPCGKHPFLQCRPACSLMGTRPIWLLPCPGPGPQWAPRVCPGKVNHIGPVSSHVVRPWAPGP